MPAAPRNSGISRRLIAYVVSFSSLVTLAITAAQLYREYQDGVAEVGDRVTQIETLSLRGLTDTLWNLYEKQIQTQLEALIQLPDVQYLEIRADGEIVASAGERRPGRVIFRTLPMVYERGDDERIPIGQLMVVASLEGVEREVLDRALIILVSNAFKTALVSVFIFLIFRFLVTKHLVRISNHIGKMIPGDLGQPLTLDRPPRNDELDRVVETLNDMGTSLEQAQDQLELRVVERTAELNDEIQEHRKARAALVEAKEQAERANQAKSRFLSAVSHDLRQPLQAIRLFGATLEDSLRYGDPATREEDLEVARSIGQSVDALGELLDSQLDFSKLASGLVEPEVTGFSLEPMLRELRQTFQGQAEQKGLRLRVVPCPAWVRSDPILVRRVLDNLVSNAVRYTASGGGILVGCRRRGERIRVEVRDGGIGIAQDQMERIFDEFHQLDNPARQSRKGFGLGLAIVRRTVDLLGHDLDVRSTPGRGTTFALTLPKAENPNGPYREPEAEEGEKGRERAGRERVLVIEDDPTVLRSTVSLLRSWGYQPLTASSSDEALGLLANSGMPAPDLVVVDYQLPGPMDGIETYRAILAEKRRTIPGIIVSGDTDPDHLKAFTGSGLIHLTKPVDPQNLRRHLKDLLDRRQ